MADIDNILEKDSFSREELVRLLSCNDDEFRKIISQVSRQQPRGRDNTFSKTGLINLSDNCNKDCFYCIKRRSNNENEKSKISDKDTLNQVRIAHKNGFDSIIIQDHDCVSPRCMNRVIKLYNAINSLKKYRFSIILSLGEQDDINLRYLYKRKARTYLLRLGTTVEALHGKIHPYNLDHDLNRKICTLKKLIKAGFNTGTGIITGLPFQTIEDIADDIFFLKMVNPGFCQVEPFLLHENTPVVNIRDSILPREKCIDLAFRTIVVLNLILKNTRIISIHKFHFEHHLFNVTTDLCGEITNLKKLSEEMNISGKERVNSEMGKLLQFV